MRWRGRPPIGGQDNDGVSLLCSAPYTLLPLRGISPQGETRNLRRKTESYILHVPPRHSPLWWLALPPFPVVRWGGKRKAPLNFSFPLEGNAIKLRLFLIQDANPLPDTSAGRPAFSIFSLNFLHAKPTT